MQAAFDGCAGFLRRPGLTAKKSRCFATPTNIQLNSVSSMLTGCGRFGSLCATITCRTPLLRGALCRSRPSTPNLSSPKPNLFGTVLVEDVGDAPLIRWLFGSYRQDDVFGCAIAPHHGFDHVNACGCGAAN